MDCGPNPLHDLVYSMDLDRHVSDVTQQDDTLIYGGVGCLLLVKSFLAFLSALFKRIN